MTTTHAPEEKKPNGNSIFFASPGHSGTIDLTGFDNLKLPSLKDELLSTRRATKEKGDKKPKKIFSSIALNLTVQYVGACQKRERSKKRKAYFRMGNLSTLNISKEASEYTQQDSESLHNVRLYPKYNSFTLQQWPKLEEAYPLHPDDYIVLESYEVYIISVDPELCEELKPGDFVTLVNVLFEVFASRDSLPVRIKDKYKAPNGNVDWKKIPEEELAWSPKTDKIDPNFYFNAKSYKALPSVSKDSLLKIFDKRGLVLHYIPKPSESEIEFHTRNNTSYSARSNDYTDNATDTYTDTYNAFAEAIAAGGVNEEDAAKMSIYEDSMNEKMATRPEAFRMPDRFSPIPVYLIPFDGKESGEPMKNLTSDGMIQTIQTCYIAQEEINKFDSDMDKEDLKRLKDFKVAGDYEKAWRFCFDVIQALYKATFDEDTGKIVGFEEHPVLKEKVLCRMNIYCRTIESSFGIFDGSVWERFIKLYKVHFSGILQCKVNWGKTKRRMERIQTLSTGAIGSIAVDDTVEMDVDASSLNYSHAYEYSCDSVMFNMRDILMNIGVHVSADMARCFTQKLVFLRRQGKAPYGRFTDVKNMEFFNTHAVACLNELTDHGTAIRYIENGIKKQYVVVLLPTKLYSTSFKNGIFTWPSDDTELGDQLISILYDIGDTDESVSFQEGVHDARIAPIAKNLIDSDFKTDKDNLTALLFAIWPINKATFSHEAETVAKYLGIPEEVNVVEDFLNADGESQHHDVDATVAEGDGVGIQDEFDMMDPSQQYPNSFEQDDMDAVAEDIELPPEAKRHVTFDATTKEDEPPKEDESPKEDETHSTRSGRKRSAGDRRSSSGRTTSSSEGDKRRKKTRPSSRRK